MTSLTQGFATIENCVSLTECDALSARFADAYHAGSRCLLDQDWCRELASRLRIRLQEAVPEISRLVAVQCTYFNKSPGANWLVAYHQDRSIPVCSEGVSPSYSGHSVKAGVTFVHGADGMLASSLAVRLHLDDSTLDNGPLRVIPGSHLSGTLSPEGINAVRAAAAEQPLIVGRGGAILMRPLLLHASSKSRANVNRRVLHFLFAPRTPPAGLQWRLTID